METKAEVKQEPQDVRRASYTSLDLKVGVFQIKNRQLIMNTSKGHYDSNSIDARNSVSPLLASQEQLESEGTRRELSTVEGSIRGHDETIDMKSLRKQGSLATPSPGVSKRRQVIPTSNGRRKIFSKMKVTVQ